MNRGPSVQINESEGDISHPNHHSVFSYIIIGQTLFGHADSEVAHVLAGKEVGQEVENRDILRT